jgi:hypothetical protein
MKYIKTINSVLLAAFMVVLFGVLAFPAGAQADYYPVTRYQYPSQPSYPSQPHYPQLTVSCYPMPLSVATGDSATWSANAQGGSGNYNYTWSGTDGLYGSGSSIAKTYYQSGYKSATVSVSSGGQTVSHNCDGTINVYSDNNYHDYPPVYYPPVVYNPPVYYPPVQYYSPLSVSCSPSTSYISGNGNVTWTAYPSGGNGSYSYSWSGTDGLYGSSQVIYKNYYNSGYSNGVKTANVTVYSNGQSVTQYCGTVNVTGSTYYYPNYSTYTVNPIYAQYPQNDNTLQIGCYSDPSSVRVNQPVTWQAEVTGGVGPYTYSWTGSDGLTGSQSSIIKYYNTAGSKSAIVSVTSADGRTGNKACTNAVAVKSNVSTVVTKPAVAPTSVVPVTTNTDTSKLSAASLFSLQNIPWGWVAILIILVLFATVLYLLFNKEKI